MFADGRGELSFSGKLDIKLTHDGVTIDVPQDPAAQVQGAIWLMAAATTGEVMGQFVHKPLLGFLAGIWAGKTLWNRRRP